MTLSLKQTRQQLKCEGGQVFKKSSVMQPVQNLNPDPDEEAYATNKRDVFSRTLLLL